MTQREILLGVDGGNTKTIAVVASADGTVLGVGRVDRQADMYAVGLEAALGVYREAVDLALAAATSSGADGSTISAAAFSLAGADWPEDIALLTDRLRASWPFANVVNDAIGALRVAVPRGPGVVVVCGTGSATGALGPDGTTWHTSFWQLTQGGHELGMKALQAVVRAELGIDPPTALTGAVLHATGEPSVEALLHHATARSVAPRRDPAVLTPILLDVAAAGDPGAAAVVTEHGADLGRTALAAARRVGIGVGREPWTLALTGGVLRHGGATLRTAIVETVRAEAPDVEVVTPALEPAAGALLLAFDAAGLATGSAVRDRIAEGLASASLFETHPGRAPR
jgi:N-acetylglucosamine kinase-like BadF-type ATPase